MSRPYDEADDYEIYVDEQGRRRARPRDHAIRCDFCLATLAVPDCWTYPAAPMEIVGPEGRPYQASDDDWAACQTCHELIAGSRIGELVERMVAEHPRNFPETEARVYPPVSLRRRWARENLLRFMDARTGPPHHGEPF